MSESHRLPTVVSGLRGPAPAPPPTQHREPPTAHLLPPAAHPPLPSISGHLLRLRRNLRQQRALERAQRDAATARLLQSSGLAPSPHPAMSSSSNPNSRRRLRHNLRRPRDSSHPESQAPEAVDLDTYSQIANGDLPNLLGSRAPPVPTSGFRFHPSDRFAGIQNARRRARQSHNMANDEMANLLELHDATDRLAQVNEDLRTMILPQPSRDREYTPSLTRPLSSGDGNEARRKRRKVEYEKASDAYPRIAYGYEGQVVSGRLNMQLVSSDGGIVDGSSLGPDYSRTEPAKYAAANVLRDDNSVYCTLSSRCNIVLRHQGQTAFTLDKLVIKAPRAGYTDPVQEGLVFVSMKKDEIFDRTSQYHIYHFPSSRFGQFFASTRRRHGSRNASETSLPSFNSLTADDTWPPLHQPMNVDYGDNETESDEDGDADDQSIDLAVSRGNNSSTGRTESAEESRWWFMRSWEDPDDALAPPRTLGNAQAEYRDMLDQQDFDDLLRRGAATSQDRRRRRSQLARGARRDYASSMRAMERASRWSSAALRSTASESTSGAAYRDLFEASDMDEDSSGMSDDGETAPVNDTSPDTALMEPNARFSMISHSELRKRGRRHVTRHLKRIEASFDEPDPDHKKSDMTLTDARQYIINGSNDRFSLPMSAVGDVMQDTVDGRNVTLRHVRTVSTIQSDNKITIKFDPPISARFVLLKLWNPKSNDGRSDGTGNIDIQSVQAYGWAGPRFFPATDMR